MVTRISYRDRIDPQELQLSERVVQIRRVAKVVKGGRHLRFNALVVVGDGQGYVGIGMGKADAVPDAVRKGVAIARSNLMKVPLRDHTIPHIYVSKFGGSTVLVRPAAPGTGIVAGGGVRAVMEMAGVTDVVTKSHGSSNPINVVKATLKALASLRDPIEDLARRRPDLAAQQRAREEARRLEAAPPEVSVAVKAPVAVAEVTDEEETSSDIVEAPIAGVDAPVGEEPSPDVVEAPAAEAETSVTENEAPAEEETEQES